MAFKLILGSVITNHPKHMNLASVFLYVLYASNVQATLYLITPNSICRNSIWIM